jgi:hypothetical protein
MGQPWERGRAAANPRVSATRIEDAHESEAGARKRGGGAVVRRHQISVDISARRRQG